ncbi:26S protease regulatory subunit S10b [Striga asiatica]|uniref:26S protease regulatory subunit S10b n=1 Tax=Striga asiatica TaxID=4170 RepID=A0A5A7R1M3_STRAF|nr:26S protease regulatory subunit S10b [Striga asiatica]
MLFCEASCDQAIASDIDASFLKVVSSAIIDKYIGESARLIREIFGYARDHQPCIIFMVEIDAIGGCRFSEGTNADREIQRTLMELFVLNVLDPALLRPGRLDRKIEIPLPNEQSRMEILKFHSSGVAKHGEIDYEAVVKLAEGSNGADLRNICTEAGIVCDSGGTISFKVSKAGKLFHPKPPPPGIASFPVDDEKSWYIQSEQRKLAKLICERRYAARVEALSANGAGLEEEKEVLKIKVMKAEDFECKLRLWLPSHEAMLKDVNKENFRRHKCLILENITGTSGSRECYAPSTIWEAMQLLMTYKKYSYLDLDLIPFKMKMEMTPELLEASEWHGAGGTLNAEYQAAAAAAGEAEQQAQSLDDDSSISTIILTDPDQAADEGQEPLSSTGNWHG